MSDIFARPPEPPDPLDVECMECGRLRGIACNETLRPFCDSRCSLARRIQGIVSSKHALREREYSEYFEGFNDAIDLIVERLRGQRAS